MSDDASEVPGTGLEGTLARIPVEDLVPGMAVADVGVGWLEHGFWRSSFVVENQAEVDRVVASGTREVVINLRGGLAPRALVERLSGGRAATPQEPVPAVVAADAPAEVKPFERVPFEALAEFARRGPDLARNAGTRAGRLLWGVSGGRGVDRTLADEAAGRLSELTAVADALLPSFADKSRGYSDGHAAGAGFVAAAVARAAGFGPGFAALVAAGSMLTDAGMAEPGRGSFTRAALGESEREAVRGHVARAMSLKGVDSLDGESLAAMSGHHERVDGTGYPDGLSGDMVLPAARIAAVADAYDAMVSDRPWRRGLTPAGAVARIWGGAGFGRDAATALVRALGIWPVGSLLLMESGAMGVVVAQGESALRPVVRLFYDTKKRSFRKPETIGVGKGAGAVHGAVVGAQGWDRWGLDRNLANVHGRPG